MCVCIENKFFCVLTTDCYSSFVFVHQGLVFDFNNNIQSRQMEEVELPRIPVKPPVWPPGGIVKDIKANVGSGNSVIVTFEDGNELTVKKDTMKNETVRTKLQGILAAPGEIVLKETDGKGKSVLERLEGLLQKDTKVKTMKVKTKKTTNASKQPSKTKTAKGNGKLQQLLRHVAHTGFLKQGPKRRQRKLYLRTRRTRSMKTI
jgi:hypothetical protein